MSYYLILVRFRGLLCYLTQYHIFRVLFTGFSQGGKRSCLVLIHTRGNLFLPVRLLVWADGRGTVARADSAACVPWIYFALLPVQAGTGGCRYADRARIPPLYSATPKWLWPESNESGVATTP
jgi:hypothetical protein